MIIAADYNYPLGIIGGYFNGRVAPPFPDFVTDYHTHFMRYIYYLCIMNAVGEYPVEMSIEQIKNAFEKSKESKCKVIIKKILIGEAPPPTLLNYFYNPSPLRWNATTGSPTRGQSWTSTIKNTLFPGVFFPNTVSFLEACAREGFLLLDLFPYPILYSGTRGTIAYRNACLSAFGFGAAPYPHNINNTLNYLRCCIQDTIAFGFALKSFGEIIMVDGGSVANFNAWCVANGISLDPPGSINLLRPLPAPFVAASDYLRVCGIPGPSGPNSQLLALAGF